METLAEQPPRQERFKSFDPLASVHLLRFDLQTCGEVLPETLERVQDEELSYLMEGIDRAACSSFALQRQGNDFVYFDRGEWKPYGGMLLTGIEAAKADTNQDFRKRFLIERAKQDFDTYNQMRKLTPGQKHAWYSPYPYAEAAQYGDDFIRSCGFVPDRKMGFLYMATCEANGNVILESQTIDQSNERAFAASMRVFDTDPTADLHDMVHAYDMQLGHEQGGTFYAGRRGEEQSANAYKTILEQRDLIKYFMDGLQSLAKSWHLTGKDLEYAVKKHTYGVWAAFKKRIDGETICLQTSSTSVPLVGALLIQQEVVQAFNEFVSQGRVLVGCGGEIAMLKGEQNILNADSQDVFKSTFGGKDEDKFGPLVFTCKNGHVNRRPRGKLISECRVKSCSKGSVGCA